MAYKCFLKNKATHACACAQLPNAAFQCLKSAGRQTKHQIAKGVKKCVNISQDRLTIIDLCLLRTPIIAAV